VELTKPTARVDRGPQPGDRRPAPGDLELVQTFLNSRWDLTSHNEEELASPGAVSTWLVEHGLFDSRHALTEPDRRRVLEVRGGLREMLFVNNGALEDPEVVGRLNRALRAPRIYVQLAVADTPAFKSQPRDLDGALALIATIVALSQLDRSWSRMKACRGRDCGWAFYDHSRNQASSWCAMSVCGSRAKVRAYRERRRGPGT
jgi:predicted RNA-binding Zn ribbon-like protein